MVYKRSFGDEESYDLPCKHQRQLDYSNQLTYFAELAPSNDITHMAPSSVAEGGAYNKSQVVESVGNVTELTIGAGKEFNSGVPGGISSFSWVSSSTSEECPRLEVVGNFPDVFEAGCSRGASVQCDDLYSSLFDFPPRKIVPVGSDHQAIIPQYAASKVMADNGNWERLMGTCVLPMPDPEALVYSVEGVGNGRADNCNCSDRGEVRCVRYHILEARDKLRDFLGQETFTKLGFNEMGEIVARKWTEAELQVFQNIVFLNPVAFGQSFWTILAEVFPSRSKMELVSYYFNVFMLRRRAEQNRSDHMNIDSDNDEWQRNDDESGMSEEEEQEGSVVESPADQNDHDVEDGAETYDSNINDNAVEDWFVTREEEDYGGIDDVSVAGLEPIVEVDDKILKSRRGDQDLQDDSCTSYECHPSDTDHNKRLQDQLFKKWG